MRAFSFIMSLYLVALAGFPCSDSKSCVDERKNGVIVEFTGDHDHSSSEKDFCSPFCICSCCSVNVQMNQDQGIDLTPPDYNGKLITLYNEKPLLLNGKSIWQPPKI